jgi:hypothetical protein
MYFMPVVTGKPRATVGASGTAKQIPIPGMNNIFPFAPMWLPAGASTDPPGNDPYGMAPARKPDGSGYQQGGVYTLRGPSNIKDTSDMCTTDATDLAMDSRKATGQPDRGYIWDTHSASDIRDAILGNETPVGKSINVGDSVLENCDFCLVEGTKQTEVNAIQDRVATDSDPNTVWYKDYVANGGDAVNGQRVVVVPVVTGLCGTLPTGQSVTCPSITLPNGTTTTAGANTVVGFAGFFLRPANMYGGGGNNPICAEYIGPWVSNQAAGGGAGGAFRVKLVQ